MFKGEGKSYADAVANLKKRKHVSFDSLVDDYTKWLYCKRDVDDETISKADKDKRAELCSGIGARGFVPWDVPYMFCSDEYAGPPGGNPSCQRWDHGVTYTEKVLDIKRQYDAYYFWRNFRHDKFSDSVFGSLGRVQSSFFMPIMDMYQYFYLYVAIIGEEIVDPSEMSGYEFLFDYAQAATMGLQFLGEVITTPDWGTHCKVTDEAVKVGLLPGVYYPTNVARGTCDSSVDTFDIPLGIGKPRYNRYSIDKYREEFDPEDYLNEDRPLSGYQVTMVGSFMEKLYALQTLISTESFFYGVDFVSSLGAYDINTFRLFPHEILDLMGGLIVGNLGYSKFAGKMVDGKYKAPCFADLSKRFPGSGFHGCKEAEGDYVYPADNFALSFYSAFYVVLGMSSIYDGQIGFDDYTRVVIEGSGDDFLDTIQDDAEGNSMVVEFTDPNSGITYRALQTPDGQSVSAALITHANEVATKRLASLNIYQDMDKTDTERETALGEYMLYDGQLNTLVDKVASLRQFNALYGNSGYMRVPRTDEL